MELESFFSQQTIRDIVENLQEDVANWSIQDFLRGLPSESDFLKRYLAHRQEENPDWAELDAELAELVSEHSDLEEAFREWVAPRLSDLLTERQVSGSADVRLYDMQKRTPVSHRDVGIGVSQVLPVLVQAYASQNAIVAMEQPEIHLHPKLQAELGDVFIESALGDQKNRFVLETHSEHLILRILRRIRETSGQKNDATPAITPDDIALLYVDTDGSGTRILNLRTDKRGRLLDRCPGGFFEEDFEELF